MSLQLTGLGNFFSFFAEFMDLCNKEFMLLYTDYAVEKLHTIFSSQTKNLKILKRIPFIETYSIALATFKCVVSVAEQVSLPFSN